MLLVVPNCPPWSLPIEKGVLYVRSPPPHLRADGPHQQENQRRHYKNGDTSISHTLDCYLSPPSKLWDPVARHLELAVVFQAHTLDRTGEANAQDYHTVASRDGQTPRPRRGATASFNFARPSVIEELPETSPAASLRVDGVLALSPHVGRIAWLASIYS